MKKKYALVILVIAFSMLSISIFNHTSIQQLLYGQKDVFAGTLYTGAIKQVEWNNLTCQERESFLERLIMLNYVPQIKDAVDKYYGNPRGFDIEKLKDLKVIAPYEYEMKIQISTYIGAHNPPYGTDVATIHFHHLHDGKIANFEHIV